MTRDEEVRERTVKRFLECEAKRAEARDAALKQGKSEDEAREIAHEAAKAHWNAWAEDILAERKTLRSSGVWSLEETRSGSLEPKNAETRKWMEEAATSFSKCLFLSKRHEETQQAGQDEGQPGDNELPVKVIPVDGEIVDLRGFVFPGKVTFSDANFKERTLFENAIFENTASYATVTFSLYVFFVGATFKGDANFDDANFDGGALFSRSAFGGDAWFDSATFRGNVSFNRATFSGDAYFKYAQFWQKSVFPAVFNSMQLLFSNMLNFWKTTPL